MNREAVETVVIGGGQAGLAVGYHLQRRGLPFVILDENARVGESWRKRWDSLRLFTPARYSGLPGMPFPGPSSAFPTKEEVAAYLEAYVRRWALPVRTGVRVDRLASAGDRFEVSYDKGSPRRGRGQLRRRDCDRARRPQDGYPVVEGGRVLEVSNVIWCTGYTPDFDWIDFTVPDRHGFPIQNRGIVESVPGLYFIGLVFLPFDQFSVARRSWSRRRAHRRAHRLEAKS